MFYIIYKLKSKIWFIKKMKLLPLIKRGSVLYFPGDYTYFKNQDKYLLYKKIFSKLGISFKELEKKECCGIHLLEAGYESEARKIARKNYEEIKKLGVNEIITDSPECYKMFVKDYPKLLPDFDIKIINMWKLIAEKLQKKPSLVKNSEVDTITYHDNCYLGRYSEMYDEPRIILKIIGYELKEMSDNRENSMCCGSCGGLTITNPELADKIAKERILQAKRINVKKMVVASTQSYNLLRKNAGEDLEILELSDVLASALGIKIKDDELNLEKTEQEKDEEDIIRETKANIKLDEEIKEEEAYKNGKENKE
jgi:Fe-S oxidoreductase